MRTLVALSVLLPSLAFADDASDAKALLDRWADAQQKGDLATYGALYAKKFFGVRTSGPRVARFDHDGWLKDRARMFKKPMRVEVADLKVVPNKDGVELDFKQTFTQGTYHDEGPKVMTLAREDGALRITSERPLESRTSGTAGQPNDAWKGAIGAVTKEGIVLPWHIDDSFGAGPAKRHTDKHGHEVARRAVSDKVPAAAKSLVGQTVEIIGQDGTERPVVITGLAVVTVVDHVVIDGEVGAFDSGSTRTPGAPRLIAEVDTKASLTGGIVARAAGSKAPVVKHKSADRATTATAIAKVKSLAKGFSIEHSDVRTFDVTFDGKPRRLVSILVSNDGGCGDGQDLWALYAVDGTWTLLSAPGTGTIIPTIAVDLDGDGWPELLGNEGGDMDDLGFDLDVSIVRRWRDLYQSFDKLRVDYLGCPC